MKFKHTRGDLIALGIVLVTLAIAVPTMDTGSTKAWIGLGILGFCALVLLLHPFLRTLREPIEHLSITEWGVRRTRGKNVSESLAWGDLSKAAIMTTSDGPGANDVFFALQGSDGNGVLIPQALAAEHKLLEQLQHRLPGFDNEAVVKAMGCAEERVFVCWERA